jgi:tetratricopeptide (TPR) repeat protein
MLFAPRNLQFAIFWLLLFTSPVLAADWERGVALFKKEEYRAALAEFQDLVRERPGSTGAWYYIGLCEFNLKRYDRVQLPLSRAIDLLEVRAPQSPDIASAHYTIGFSLYLLAQYEKAIDPLKRYIDLNTRMKRDIDPSARVALGRAYYYLERYDEALPLLAANKGENAKEAGANSYLIGLLYFKREDDDKAIPALRDAVKANAEDANALDLLAESLMRKARKMNQKAAPALWAEAAAVGEQLKTVRNDGKTAGVLGRAYLGALQFEKAVEPLEKLTKENSDNGQTWLYYGIALSRSGKTRKAMEALEITIQLLPDSIPAMNELAFIYEGDKQYQQALRIYEKAYALHNDPAIKQSIERVQALMKQQP